MGTVVLPISDVEMMHAQNITRQSVYSKVCVLSSKLQKHRVIKELVDGHILTHTLQSPQHFVSSCVLQEHCDWDMQLAEKQC